MQCDGHMTMSSMTSYEAAFMSVKSLMLCPRLQSNDDHNSYFRDLIELGFAELGSTFDSDEIAAWASCAHRLSNKFSTSISSDTAWNSAIEWMLGKVYKSESQAYQ